MKWEDAVGEISRTFWLVLAVAALGSVIAFQPNTLGSYPDAVQQIEVLARVRLSEKQLKTEFLRQRKQYQDEQHIDGTTFYDKFYRYVDAHAAMRSALVYQRPLYRFVVWDSEFDKGMDLSEASLKKIWEMANWTSLTDPSNCFPEMDDDELERSFAGLKAFTRGDWQGIYGLVERPCDELTCTLRIFTRQGVFEMKPHLKCGYEAIPTLRNVVKALANDKKDFDSAAIFDVLPILGNSKPADAIKYLTSKTEFSYLGVTIGGRWTILTVPLIITLLSSVLFAQANHLEAFLKSGADDHLSILLMNDLVSRFVRTIIVFAPACVAAGFYFKTVAVWEWLVVGVLTLMTFALSRETWRLLNALSALIAEAGGAAGDEADGSEDAPEVELTDAA